MLRDEVYMAFVESIVTLARALQVKTVAEFVEDAEVLAAVAELGIDYAQGYYIRRPGPLLQGAEQSRGAMQAVLQ
jgi:EAL domain-containing protein (putative c-di-GMP-specific phosphodiesterase class I)